MDAPDSRDALERDLAKARDALAELDGHDTQLQSALHDVEHQMRRCTDALERSGWKSVEAQARKALLTEGRAAIVADRQRIREQRAELARRAATIRRRLGELDGN